MSWEQYERTLSHLVDEIKFGLQGSRSRIGVALLIGAGCSVSAGIPDAKGMVDLIRQKLPEVYKGALGKARRNSGSEDEGIIPSYQECMDFLTPKARRKLNFINSDGWNAKPPIENHRCAPSLVCPTNNTKQSIMTFIAYKR